MKRSRQPNQKEKGNPSFFKADGIANKHIAIAAVCFMAAAENMYMPVVKSKNMESKKWSLYRRIK